MLKLLKFVIYHSLSFIRNTIVNHQGNADQNQNEMQLTPAGMSILKRQEIKSAGEDVGEGGPCAVLVGMKLVQSLQKTVQCFLRKLKIEPPYDPAIPSLGITIYKANEITI